MEEMKNDTEDASFVSEEAQETPVLSEGDGENAVGETATDWQSRCLTAESALADSLAFATLWAPYAKEGEVMEQDPAYARFLALRGKGLSVNEAFAAAGWNRTPVRDARQDAPSKAHLFSTVPAASASRGRMSGEELAIARELLGEDYPTDKLEQLFRRVTKG